jgi:NAD(P)-dependent dehydrogenase (short-subunit alcohol dehydrogenase family)
VTSTAGSARSTAVVTGCSSGIGLATAVALARRGHHVVATVRDTTRAAALLEAAGLAGVGVEIATLDVTVDHSVSSCIGDVLERHGHIDVLVNNAGVGFSGTLEELSIEELRRSLEVNFLGVARVTKAVLPTMRARGGRLIAVSSTAGALGHPFNDAYCAAKFALEGLYESLSPVAATFGIHVSIIEPGPVAGGFEQRSAGVRTRDVDDPFAALWHRFRRVAAGAFERAQAPEDVARVIAEVASDPSPRLRYQTSSWARRIVEKKLADPTGERVTEMTMPWLR